MNSVEMIEQDQELTDVILCYKAMGLSLDDGPSHIEQTYMGLTEAYRKNLSSPDPVIREDARKNIALMKEMYDKIKGSITYNTMVREQEKSGKLAEEQKAAKVKPQVVKLENHLMNCPSCRNVISKRSKSCPICKYRFLSPLQKLMDRFVTTRNVAIAGVILVLLVVAIVFILNPDIVQRIVG
jgi:hypothetical protein